MIRRSIAQILMRASSIAVAVGCFRCFLSVDVQISTISIPNPFFEGRNSVYVLHADPITLIDTGVATTKAFNALREQLQEIKLSLSDIRRVVLTHKHIDHIGNAWRIQQESHAEIFIHESECKAIRDVDPDSQRFNVLVNQKLDLWSVPPEKRLTNSSDNKAMPSWEIESAQATPLVHGQTLPFENGGLEIVHTPGHTMGSICLRIDEKLFSGDHVLYEMSPNIGAGDMRHQGVLKKYLHSLRHVQGMDCEQAFPGHGPAFPGIAQRCEELYQHHEQRLDRIVDILEEAPKTVYQIATELFGELDEFHVVLGCAEANAHLEFLLEEGRIVETNDGFLKKQDTGEA